MPTPEMDNTQWSAAPLPFEEGRHFDVNPESGCHEWKRAKNGKGYGVCWNGETKKFGLSHRVAYETQVGPLEPDMTVDHTCRNVACLNPAHLEKVTRTENLYRQAASRREELEAARQAGGKLDRQGNVLMPETPLAKAAFVLGQLAFLQKIADYEAPPQPPLKVPQAAPGASIAASLRPTAALSANTLATKSTKLPAA